METEKGDMIKLNYTGRIKDSGEVFDTTYEDVAEEEGIKQEDQEFGPRTIIIGSGHVVEGLDTFLEEREADEDEVSITAEEGFGERKSKLLETFSLGKFEDQDINPFPGMRLQVNGAWGTVRSVSSGRVRMDFNHPLAGKDLEYEIELVEKIEDPENQVEELIDKNFDEEVDYEFDSEEKELEITSELDQEDLKRLQVLKEDLSELGIELKDEGTDPEVDIEGLKDELESQAEEPDEE